MRGPRCLSSLALSDRYGVPPIAGSATTLAVRRLGSPAPRRWPVRGWPPVWTGAGRLLVAGLFRAAQNMGQTTFALFGREDLSLGAATIGSLGTVLGAFALVGALLVGGRLPTSKASAAVGAGVCLLGTSLVVLGSATSPCATVPAATAQRLSRARAIRGNREPSTIS